MAANTVLVKGASGTLADTGVKPPDNTAVTPPDNGVKPPDNNVVTPPDNGVKPPDHTEPVNPVADNGTKIPAPQGNVMFKVQIMALHKDIPNSYFSQAYGINEPIEKEMHEGYQKYILSKSASPNYKDAHDYRDNVRPKVKDAWVTAYINGQRRTCQEALMVSGQKWLR
jgi:hypothetical protein